MKKRIIRLIMLPALALVLILTSVFAVFPTIHTAQALPGEDESVLDPTFDPSDLDDYQPEYNGPEFDPNDIDASAATESGSGGFGLCQEQSGALSWIVCPVIITVAKATDAIYSIFADTLSVDPIQQSSDSPIYLVWQYMRRLTNIIFIIVLLIVLYSQLTGVGINNYGVKCILPRLIIAVILINLSYIICMFAVDISNIIGNGLYEFLMNIKESVLGSNAGDSGAWIDVVSALTGVTIAGAAGLVVINAVGGLGWLVWVFIPLLFSALGAVVIGFITLAARQALVFLLVMISPLAFVAYLLPNTERFFELWRKTLTSMLVFYPMFSFLLGGSQLAGGAMIAAANGDPLGIIIGLAVEVLPLFASIKLMQMSNTVLGSVGSGLKKLFSPAQAGIANWAGSHAERSRQVHLGTSKSYGARARRELDYRRKLRELDTANALRIREGKALERAYTKLASRDGIAKDGTNKYKKKPNKLTERAALASSYDVSSGQAKSDYENTIRDYGKHFEDKTSQAISARSGQAFLELAKQQYRAANIAQGDQDFLLKNFMEAYKTQYSNPYEFNRLFKSASGSIGYLGESSIIGQVIAENSRIEQRRRGEARIILNKFGHSKPRLRAMLFDSEYMNDDGYETDENGNVIQGHDYKMLPIDPDDLSKGYHKHRTWQHYIGVHQKTRKEITKAEYDALSLEARKVYDRVNFLPITDDQGQIVSKIYATDAGFMKEAINDDIAVGDPITRRYVTSIGKALTDEEKQVLRDKYHVNLPDDYNDRVDSTGILRRYHSTISAQILGTKYKDHDAAMTPMLLAQANNGYIHTTGQFYIGALDSLAKATKPGSFLINDEYAIKTWTNLIESVTSTEKGKRFEDFIQDPDVETFLNVNGLPLHGLRLSIRTNSKGEREQFWEKIDRTNTSITLEDRKNYVKHGLIPAVAKKLVGMMNSNLSSGILDNQKPGTQSALVNLLNTLEQAGLDNMNPNIPIDKKLDEDFDLFDTPEPGQLRTMIRNTRSAIRARLQGNEEWDAPIPDEPIYPNKKQRQSNNNSNDSNNNSSNSNNSSSNSHNNSNGSSSNSSRNSNNPNSTQSPHRNGARASINQIQEALNRSFDHDGQVASQNDLQNIIDDIYDICNSGMNLDNVCNSLYDTLGERTILRPFMGHIGSIIEQHRNGKQVQNQQDVLDRIQDYNKYEDELVHELYTELITYIGQILAR